MPMYPALNLPAQALHLLNLARREAELQSLPWREPALAWDGPTCGLHWRGSRELLVLVDGTRVSTYRAGRMHQGAQPETMGDTVASILWMLEGKDFDVEP